MQKCNLTLVVMKSVQFKTGDKEPEGISNHWCRHGAYNNVTGYDTPNVNGEFNMHLTRSKTHMLAKIETTISDFICQ